jgi:hypothetical protein
MEKFPKPKIEGEIKEEKESIIDIDLEISEEREKEILEKYEDLEFLIEGVGMEFEELTEEEIENEFVSLDEDIPFILDPVSGFGLEVDEPEEEKEIKKVILKQVFENLSFDPKNPEQIGEEKEPSAQRGEVVTKYFKTNNPNLVLSFDGVDWCVRKTKENK